MKTTFLLSERLGELEQQTGKRYSYSEIARRTNLSRHTVKAMASNTISDCQLSTLIAIAQFFESEGLPVQVGELFVVERVD